MAIDVSSGPVFLSKKRRISMDVSSALIFLTKTNKQRMEGYCDNSIGRAWHIRSQKWGNKLRRDIKQ